MTQGAFAIVQKGNQILLVKPPEWVSQYSCHWNFPGGVVERGESLENAAEREVLEETGIHCAVEKLIDSAYNKKFDTQIHIFTAAYVSGELSIQENEISDAGWFTPEEAVRIPLAFDIKKTIEKLTVQRDKN